MALLCVGWPETSQEASSTTRISSNTHNKHQDASRVMQCKLVLCPRFGCPSLVPRRNNSLPMAARARTPFPVARVQPQGRQAYSPLGTIRGNVCACVFKHSSSLTICGLDCMESQIRLKKSQRGHPDSPYSDLCSFSIKTGLGLRFKIQDVQDTFACL